MLGRHSTNPLLKSAHTVLVAQSRNARRATARPPRSSPLALPRRFITTPTPSASPALDVPKENDYSDLECALREDQSKVWGNYKYFMNTSASHALPLEVHQEVLRKCTPSQQDIRTTSILSPVDGSSVSVPHRHEKRFQTVIRNMRAAGYTPSFDDYNFVLSHFAAVGNFPGSMEVYKELQAVGHTPTAKTFGFIFQAIARRLSLPICQDARERIIAQANSTFNGLLNDMKKLDTPTFPANIDLSFRILKESMNYQAFERFMQWAYGIDLAYPDRVPLDQAERKTTTGQQLPVPFSTDALNTAVDFLGRAGNLSKMIQVFEVLTQPLPHAQEHFFSSFEDDEDDIGAVLPSTPHTLPHAQPNTTTYSMLIRYCARAGNHTLARHYLNEAIWLNKEIALDLRSKLKVEDPTNPIPTFPHPRFQLRRDHFTPVMNLGNKDKNTALLDYLQRKLSKEIMRKEAELRWHQMLKEIRWKKAFNQARRVQMAAKREAKARSAASSGSSSDGASSSTPAPGVTPSRWVDMESYVSSFAPPEGKPFDHSSHIQGLERDLVELKELNEDVAYLAGRTYQRVKERLGRRVWDGKDIFLMHKQDRVHVSKAKWNHIVNFKPMKEEWASGEGKGSEQRVEEVQSSDFFTSSAVGRKLKKEKQSPQVVREASTPTPSSS